MLRSFALGILVAVPLVSMAQSNTMPASEVNKDQSGVTQPAASTEAVPGISVLPAPTPAPEVQTKKYDERVEVTGSHIRRIDIEGASPILTVNRKDMEKTNYNSVSDIMRDTTVSAFGAAREASGSNAAGVAEIDLRGLGASNTLVLLNGHRLPTDAVTGTVDMNMIPTAAVEKVDVLKDGSSAVYGSDALAGVVNMVTRKDFNGSEVNLSQTTPEYKGGKRQDISLVNGLSKGRFSMVNVAQYRNNEVVYSRDRKFSNESYSDTGNPGSYRQAGGAWTADPNCPADRIKTAPGGGTVCRFNTGDFSTQLPALQQISLFHDNTLAVGSRLKFNTRIMGTRKTVQWSYAPLPGLFTLPAGSPATAGLVDSTGTPLNPALPVQVRYRTTPLGTRDSEITTTGFNLLEDVGIELGGGWALDVVASHNIVRTKDNGVKGYVLEDALTDAVASGKVNPLGPVGSQGDFSGLNYVTTHDTESQYSSGEVKASGPLLEMPAGDLAVAVGADVGYNRFQDSVDDMSLNDKVLSNSGSNGKGSRDTRSAFAEVSIPITKKLELSLAERYDHFSDFGDTTNPKASVAYRPTKSVMVRSSVGTGFKAPLMQSLYRAQGTSYETIIDQTGCDAEKAKGPAGDLSICEPTQYPVTSGGNPNLKPERSISYNAGAVYQPNKDLAVGFDVFHMRIKDVVGIDYDDMIKAEGKFGKAALAEKGVVINRDANGVIDSIDAPILNLSKQELTGIDFQTEYRFSKFKVGMAHSQMFYFKQEGFPGIGLTNKLGDAGLPRWRNVASVSWLPNERSDLSLSANTIAGTRKLVKEQGGSINNYTSLDLEYSYAWKKVGVLSLGVKNLIDSNPPLDDTQPNSPLNTALYDQIGRAFYTGYKATF